MDFMAKMEAAFAALSRDYTARKKAAEGKVCDWKWSKSPWFDPRPLHFERQESRPGRLMRTPPADPVDHCECGLDSVGRVVVERQYNEVGVSETFYDWSADPVEWAGYDSGGKKGPIFVALAPMESGRAVASYDSARYGYMSEEYHWVGAHVDEVKEFYAKRDDDTGKLGPLTLFRRATAEYDAKEVLERVVCHWLPSPPRNPKGGSKVTYERRKAKETVLDLQKDSADIHAYVVERVSSFNPKTNKGPGGPGPITRVDVGFDFEQGGWVALIFDTRPGAEPDGEWNGSIEGNSLALPHWPAAVEVNEAKTLKVVLPHGVERKLRAGSSETLAKLLGEMLKGVLLKARDEGVFERLPKATRCELGVEEQNGAYGWPVYKARGKENLA